MLQISLFMKIFLGLLTGACLGSFVYAAALRILTGEDLIFASSRCRSCNKTLKIQELIPILSWFLQKGYCACKKTRLQKPYLLAELGFSALIAFTWYRLPFQEALVITVFYTLIGICLFTDLLQQVLHVPTMIVLIVSGLGFNTFSAGRLVQDAILGCVVGFMLIYCFNLAYKVIRGRDGFGSGDAWLLAGIGAWTNPFSVTAVFVLASWIGAICGIAGILTKKSSLSAALPFGVYLSISSVIVGQQPIESVIRSIHA